MSLLFGMILLVGYKLSILLTGRMVGNIGYSYNVGIPGMFLVVLPFRHHSSVVG